MICPHCKRALEEAIDKIEAATEIKWPEDEKRIEVIGTNGNTGEHYEVETREAWNDTFDEEEG